MNLHKYINIICTLRVKTLILAHDNAFFVQIVRYQLKIIKLLHENFLVKPRGKKKNFHMIEHFYIKGLNATIFDNKLNMHDNY